MEHSVPPPSPPTWAEMVRRGTTLPLGQPPSHTHPGPARRHSPPLSAHILQLYQDCVAKGIRAKLIFETRGGEEEYSFFSSAVYSQRQPLQQQQQQQQLHQQQQQHQLDALTGRAKRKNALPTRDGGNKLEGDGRPGYRGETTHHHPATPQFR